MCLIFANGNWLQWSTFFLSERTTKLYMEEKSQFRYGKLLPVHEKKNEPHIEMLDEKKARLKRRY